MWRNTLEAYSSKAEPWEPYQLLLIEENRERLRQDGQSQILPDAYYQVAVRKTEE